MNRFAQLGIAAFAAAGALVVSLSSAAPYVSMGAPALADATELRACKEECIDKWHSCMMKPDPQTDVCLKKKQACKKECKKLEPTP